MGRGSSKASRGGGSHPKVDSLDVISGTSKPEKIDWVKKVMPGVSDEDAKSTVESAWHYSGSGYHKMHMNPDDPEGQRLDKLIDNPKTPVYNKDTYRGLSLEANVVEDMIATGRWSEPGVTSFSARRSTAVSFSKRKPGEVSVIVTNKGHTKGMPFKHLSQFKGENEVLQSSSTMLRGMKIKNVKKTTDSNGKITKYEIEVDDSK